MAPETFPTAGDSSQIAGSAAAKTAATFADVAFSATPFFATTFFVAAFFFMASLPEDFDLPTSLSVAASGATTGALAIGRAGAN
jgi:hypothetical protein